MEPTKDTSGEFEFALDASPIAKRFREDNFAVNMEPQNFVTPLNKFTSEPPRNEFSRPIKRFAGNIQFSATQDLNFEQLITDYTPVSRKVDQEFCRRKFSEHCSNLTNNVQLMKPEAIPNSYPPEPCMATEFIRNPSKTNPVTPFRCSKPRQRTTFDLPSSIGDKEFGPKEHQQPKRQEPMILETCENPQPTSPAKNRFSEQDISDQEPKAKLKKDNEEQTSQVDAAPEYVDEVTKRATIAEPELRHISDKTKSQSFPFKDSKNKSHQLPQSPLKAKFPSKQHLLLRATKLAVIKESPTAEYNEDPSFHAQSTNVMINHETDNQKDTANELVVPNDSAELNRTSVVPYDKQKLLDHSVSNAELELCQHWLKNDRSNALDSLKQRSEQAKAIETKLCQELEQMIINTKKILQNELEFSVRLCSIRGQCLLFQESTRLNFQNTMSISKIP